MTDGFRDDLVRSIPHLRAFARLLTRNADKADDLVQEALARALASQHQYTPNTNFRAWIFTILRNAWLSEIRRGEWKIGPLEAAAQAGVPAEQDKRMTIRDLRNALERLKPEQREVLILVGASGMSYEEAARICDCAVGTIKSRLSRARAELAAAMAGVEPPMREPSSRQGRNGQDPGGDPEREAAGPDRGQGSCCPTAGQAPGGRSRGGLLLH